MKKIVLILIILVPFIGFSQSDLVRWNGANLQPNAFLIVNNGTISANAVAGSFVTDNYSQPFPGFRGTNYNASSTTPDYGNFMEFAIRANATNEIKLTEFTFTHARGDGGPQKFEIRYSTDNSIGTAIGGITSVSQTPTLKQVNLTGITVQPNQIFFIRVYPFDRQNSGWNGGTFHIKHGTGEINAPDNGTGPTFKGTVHSTLPPVAVNDFTFTTQNTPVVINVLQNDTHNDLTAITVTEAPTNGTLQVNGLNNITYTPNSNYAGVDTFKYKLTDNIGTSNVAGVGITVNETNPTALVRWNGANTSLAAVSYNTHVVATPLTVVGGGTITNLYQQIFQASNGWPTPTENSGYLNPSKYIEFTIKSKDGYQFVANKLNLRMKTQGAGGKFEIRYSKDFSQNYFSYNGLLTENFQNFSINISAENPVLATETLYVRIYIYSIYNLFEIQHDNGGNVGPSISGIISMPVEPVTTWNGDAGWSNGTPNKTRDAIIAADFQVMPTEVLAVKNLTINANAKLTVNSGAVLSVQNDVTVLSNTDTVTPQLIIENNGSFVQVNNNGTYTGLPTSFLAKRATQLVYRYDFTYWSSPVENFTLKNVSPTTLFDKFLSWNSLTQNWTVHKSNASTPEVMSAGKGYTVRAPQSFSVEGAGTAQIHTAQFIGKPNNGTKLVPVSNAAADRWNLIGNPYPSAVSVSDFLEVNKDVLDGTLYFWTHKTPAASNSSNPNYYYTYSSTDYVAVNLAGNVSNSKVQDGPSGNSLGLIAGNDFQNIASGQSFFIKGKAANVTGNQATFTNEMRVQTSGKNDQFFRPGTSTPVDNWETTGKHRIWLNMTTAQNDFNQALVGYIENATNDLDWGYDGEVFSSGAVTLYSLSNEKNLTIQARALPFSNQDEVPLGYKTTRTGTMTISIDHVDGLFEGQAIYLQDNVLNIVHDLKESDYSFTTVPGTFENRFVLRYVPQETLGTETPTLDANSIVVFNTNNQISVKSTNETIAQVVIYDLQGRILFTKENVNAQEFATQSLSASSQVVVVKVITENKAELVKKVILK